MLPHGILVGEMSTNTGHAPALNAAPKRPRPDQMAKAANLADARMAMLPSHKGCNMDCSDAALLVKTESEDIFGLYVHSAYPLNEAHQCSRCEM